MDSLATLREPKYWLLAIATALLTLHLTVLWQLDNSEILATNILCWAVIISLLWDKYTTLSFESNLTASSLGAFLIAIMMLRSFSPEGYHPSITPFFSMLGLCLMASGFKGLRVYWKELTILAVLLLAPGVVLFLKVIDLSIQTARFSAFLLHYLGFEVFRQGIFISLPPGGIVQVYGACSGVQNILQMITISVLFLMMVPLSRIQQIICVITAIIIGFTVNSGRVVLLALLHAHGKTASFHYWHEESGSLVFSVIAVALFGAFCWLAFLREPPEDDRRDDIPC